MGLFQKNNEEERRPVNPSGMAFFRILAIGYLLYTAFEMVKLYGQGGEEAPQLWLVIVTCVLFVGVSIWIGWITYHQYKDLKEEQELEAQRMAEEELALEARRIAEEESEEIPEEESEEE